MHKKVLLLVVVICMCLGLSCDVLGLEVGSGVDDVALTRFTPIEIINRYSGSEDIYYTVNKKCN